MTQMDNYHNKIKKHEQILITGASGFIGQKVVENLLNRGFTRIRCFARPSSNTERIEEILTNYKVDTKSSLFVGNLLSKNDCEKAVIDASVIYHLAAGTGTKSFPDAYMNSVVTTRNLLDAAVKEKKIKRFVNISTFSVYSNRNKPIKDILDEECPIEHDPIKRCNAYLFAKQRQDEIVSLYSQKYNISAVFLRPGVVYGPGRCGIPGRVGLGAFGIFLHMGGSNPVPLTFVDNCADAIVLSGIRSGVAGEVFNIVDDDLPTSSQILKLYKKNVRSFNSIYVPTVLGYLFYVFWEKYARWSEGQLPAVYNKRQWHAFWKKTNYSNQKAKNILGWKPDISTKVGILRFIESCRQRCIDA